MFELKVTIGFNEETLSLLKSLGISKPTTAPEIDVDKVNENIEKLRTRTKKPAPVEVVVPVENEVVVPVEVVDETPAKVYTLEEVRAKVAKAKDKLGEITKIKAELKTFGVDKTTDLPAKHYPAFITKLEAL